MCNFAEFKWKKITGQQCFYLLTQVIIPLMHMGEVVLLDLNSDEEWSLRLNLGIRSDTSFATFCMRVGTLSPSAGTVMLGTPTRDVQSTLAFSIGTKYYRGQRDAFWSDMGKWERQIREKSAP